MEQEDYGILVWNIGMHLLYEENLQKFQNKTLFIRYETTLREVAWQMASMGKTVLFRSTNPICSSAYRGHHLEFAQRVLRGDSVLAETIRRSNEIKTNWSDDQALASTIHTNAGPEALISRLQAVLWDEFATTHWVGFGTDSQFSIGLAATGHQSKTGVITSRCTLWRRLCSATSS